MAFRRVKVLLTHFAVGLLGVILGFGLSHWLRVYISHPLAEMRCGLAGEAEESGNDDKAIFLLSQATVEDPDYYLPWESLATIYSRRGNRQLALELFQKSLKLFDKKKDYLLPASARRMEREMIRKNIDALQVQLKDKKDRP